MAIDSTCAVLMKSARTRVRGSSQHKLGHLFDDVVTKIVAKAFTLRKLPERKMCKECDLRMLCHAEGIISSEVRR